MRLKPVRRISRRPCVTVQPPHLWCCFASPQKETVVGHVALGRQLGGGWRGGGGQGECGAATGECSEETGRERVLPSSAGRQHSEGGSSAHLRGEALAGGGGGNEAQELLGRPHSRRTTLDSHWWIWVPSLGCCARGGLART